MNPIANQEFDKCVITRPDPNMVLLVIQAVLDYGHAASEHQEQRNEKGRTDHATGQIKPATHTASQKNHEGFFLI